MRVLDFRAAAIRDQALPGDLSLAPCYYGRGIAKQTNGDFDSAIADFDQAIELSPKLVHGYVNQTPQAEESGVARQLPLIETTTNHVSGEIASMPNISIR
jgi:tetratricopeptide (TPR) repeat protein